MKLVLHIGTEKTATSTLQEFLYQNRNILAGNGIALSENLGVPNNQKLAAYCMPPDMIDGYFKDKKIHNAQQKDLFYSTFYSDFDEEVKKASSSSDTMIITSEHFHSRLITRDSITKLKTFLDNFFSDIRIICYFREQSAVVKSLYSTSIKASDYQDFEEFVNKISTLSHYYNYLIFFTKWSDIFGKESLTPRLFLKNCWHEGDIRKDFISLLNNDIQIESLDYSLPDTNKSLGLIGIELGKINNRIHPRYDENGNRNPMRDKLMNIIESNPASQIGSLDFYNAFDIYDKFSESNIAFAREFLGIDGNPFPKPQPGQFQDILLDRVMLFDLLNLFEEMLITSKQENSLKANKYADTLRDISLKIYNNNKPSILDARDLIEIASMIRPQGQYIREKLSEINASAENYKKLEMKKKTGIKNYAMCFLQAQLQKLIN